MDFHIWAEQLSCCFHFRITSPYFSLGKWFLLSQIRERRDNHRARRAITRLGIWHSQDMQYCAFQPLNDIEHDCVSGSSISLLQLLTGKIRLFFAFVPFSWDLDERSNRERGNQTPPGSSFPLQEALLYTIDWKSTPASTRALEIWADCWKWTLSAGKERKQKITNSCSTFLVGKGTRRKGTVWSSRTQHPIYPKTSELWKATLFYWSKCNSLAPHAFVLSVVKLQTCLWY